MVDADFPLKDAGIWIVLLPKSIPRKTKNVEIYFTKKPLQLARLERHVVRATHFVHAVFFSECFNKIGE